MNPINEIRKRLHNHPEVTLGEDRNYICAIPKSDEGFNVSLLNDGMGFTVTYGEGWHDHLVSSVDALNCFGFGLSDRCRLKTTLAGTFAYKWAVEYLEEEEWIEDSTTGLIFFPYWRKKHIFYKQNHIATKKQNEEWYAL